MRAGRHFLHEHPLTATSWQERCVSDLLTDDRTRSVISDLCQFGLTTTDENGVKRPAMKPTRFLTTSTPIAARLSKSCPRNHKHAILLGGRAAAAAEYTNRLCVEILRGVQEQFERDHLEGCARRLLANLDTGDEPPEEANEAKDHEWEFEGDCDTTTGEPLPSKLVHNAPRSSGSTASQCTAKCHWNSAGRELGKHPWESSG